MGLSAITYTEMLAYALVHGFRWLAWEVAIIRGLDRAYRIVMAEQEKGRAT